MQSLKSLLAPRLETERLILELFDYSPAHYEVLLASMNSATAHARMGDFGIRTPGEFDKLNHSTRLNPGSLGGRSPAELVVDIDLYYVIRVKESEVKDSSAGGDGSQGPLAGGVSLAQRSPRLPPDAGWCLLEAYHGRGYAAEAARALIAHARAALGVTQVMAWPGEGNAPSQRTAQKAGLVLGGTLDDEEGVAHAVYILPGMDFAAIAGERVTLFGSGS